MMTDAKRLAEIRKKHSTIDGAPIEHTAEHCDLCFALDHIDTFKARLAKEKTASFHSGVRMGMERCAYSKGGVKYVGISGKTLKQAIVDWDAENPHG